MSTTFRVILIVVSLLVTIFMIRKIRQSKVQIEDSLFWFFFSLMLVVISIFPQIPTFLASLLGIASPVNFIFLFIIFILLIKLFYSTLRISQLDSKIKDLTQKTAIEQKNLDDKVEDQTRKSKEIRPNIECSK